MVQLTDQAAAELKALKEANGLTPAQGIKLVPEGTGVGLTVSEPAEGDEVITRDEEPLLIVDPLLTDALRGLTFDCIEVFEDGERQQRFTLRAS